LGKSAPKSSQRMPLLAMVSARIVPEDTGAILINKDSIRVKLKELLKDP
jgi:hypothetical protein